MSYYVEKYCSDGAFMDGEMSSCKKFDDYDKAKNYFDNKEYKKGFLVLSEDDPVIGTRIIEEKEY